MSEVTSTEVYKAINMVQAELAKEGITKDRKNQQQNYSFRGIDDIFNALSSLLAESKLCILPRCLKRSVIERQTKTGGTIFYVVLKVEFDFVSSIDGSKHTVTTYGEAMDSADKATNKAMSAAYKYACLQAFCIPTEGDNDADATTHVVAQKVTYIDQNQVGELLDLLTVTETLEADFCKYIKIAKLEEMPSAVFDKAKALLVKKQLTKAEKTDVNQ